jgi:transposase
VTRIICGVDVSKARLDAFVAPTARFESFDNDGEGIAELAAFCRRH